MPLPTKVFHGCHVDSVEAIFDGVEIFKDEEADFNISQKGRAFYTTVDEEYAEHWAVASKADKGNAVVIQLKVDYEGLKIQDFQTESVAGKDIGAWQTFVYNNWLDRKRATKGKDELKDVVSGFLSNADEIWAEWKGKGDPPKFDLKPLEFKFEGEAKARPVTQIAFCTIKACEQIEFVSYKILGEDGNWSGYRKGMPKKPDQK